METKLNKKTMKSYVITLLAMIMGMNPIIYGYEFSDYTWHEYNGHLYALTIDVGTWEDAQAEAVALGGNLVTINNQQENDWLYYDFLKADVPYVGAVPYTWIGFYQDHDDPGYYERNGGWKWVSGEPVTFINWAFPEPTNSSPGEDFGTIAGWKPFGEWNDWDPRRPDYQPTHGIIEISELQLQVSVDIKPGSCPNPLNVKDKGVLPVVILGTEDLDVFNIDPVSIRLEGVAPIRSSYEDVAAPVSMKTDDCDCTTEGSDGHFDLVLKFDVQEIVAALGGVYDGDKLVLTLTGKTYDGTLIEGADCVVIIAKE